MAINVIPKYSPGWHFLGILSRYCADSPLQCEQDAQQTVLQPEWPPILWWRLFHASVRRTKVSQQYEESRWSHGSKMAEGHRGCDSFWKDVKHVYSRGKTSNYSNGKMFYCTNSPFEVITLIGSLQKFGNLMINSWQSPHLCAETLHHHAARTYSLQYPSARGPKQENGR